ncbi:LysR family transcriptional regulator [Paraburkholderia sp. DHOC27]|uniref:LysR family transcriptional regulator n=1 Tax=Paraburkholderia sp. DHOC27 TaxID=2303330 RepID=UPI000E3B8CD1|nr:LysR family transcriptional regulator [Paraburkholderia sp. DHOC27]RFU49128.1 LysR family transcriptional regulator [Paraburkholderia sp. DHOC27]
MKRGELDDLVAFATIARARSFTRAAADLGLSPSALSHAIRGLEVRLGVQLLARTTRSVAPTPAGERLLRSLEPALREVKTGIEALSDWRGDPSGSLRITTFQFAAYTVLGPVLPKFLRDNPRVSVEVDIDTRLTDLVRDGFDAGIRWGNSVAQDMIAVRVSPDARMIVVAAPGYFERYPRPQTPADLEDHNCINYRFKSTGGYLPWKFERDGKEVRPRTAGQLVLDDGELAMDMILGGAGLGYLLEPQALPYLRDGQLVQVLDDFSTPHTGLHLYYPSRQITPALRALISVLRLDLRDPPLADWSARSDDVDPPPGVEA